MTTKSRKVFKPIFLLEILVKIVFNVVYVCSRIQIIDIFENINWSVLPHAWGKSDQWVKIFLRDIVPTKS